MKRSGLVLAGGIIGIIRGALGTFVGIANLAILGTIEAVIPGAGAVLVFEFLLSIAILIVSIWAIVKANDAGAASAIKGWGIVFIAAGVVDLVWTVGLMGSAPEVIGSAIGSLTALTLIGGLLVAGASGLAKRPREYA